MALSRTRQREIMREDAKRRNARDIAEFLALHTRITDPGVDPYHVSRQITGQPSQGNRTHRATEDSWSRGLASARTVGTATDSDGNPVLTQDGAATVRVTRDGETSIVPQSQFRAAHVSRRVRATAAVAQTHSGITAADHAALIASLPAIGNVE